MPTPTAPLANNPRNLAHVVFATPLDGWAYGPDLFATHDGGATWSQVSNLGGDVDSVTYADGVVWALVHSACTGSGPHDRCAYALLVSADHGRSWSPAAAQPPVHELGVTVLRPGGGLALLFSGTVAVSHDGGASWSSFPAPAACPSELPAYAQGDLWLICRLGRASGAELRHVLRSSDDGATWMEVFSQFAPGYAQFLAAVSAQHAFLGVGRGSLLRTDDGGRTWSPAIPALGNSYANVSAVVFVDGLHGWMADDDDLTGRSGAAIWRTADGGLQWQRVAIP